MKTEIYKHIEVLVNRYPVLNSVKDEIVEAYFLLVESYKNEGKLLIAGNGGSAADAEHIVGELMKGFKLPRKLNENFTDKLLVKMKSLDCSGRKLARRAACYCIRWTSCIVYCVHE